VNIGGALAEARTEAGLTITQVSERTRIRETIIRDIERGDYSACGGDYYARGHIRAIARVVGTDPVPLIDEYDAARRRAPEPAATDHSGPDRVVSTGISGTRPDPDAGTNPDLFSVPSRPGDTLWQSARRRVARISRQDADRPGVAAAENRPAYSPAGITAAEAFRPGLPMDFERRRPRGVRILLLVVLALVGAVVYLLVSRGSSPSRAPGAPRSHHTAAAAANRTTGPASSTTTPGASTGPLLIASAAAFGPAGIGHGDDPQNAALAIDSNPATAWHTDWYATAELGGLQSGTGLLLSLGNTATIMSATVELGRMPGGSIELRAGDTPVLADLPVVATSANPGGTVTMPLSVPVRARYALLWFTSLPPDGAGTYQAGVYSIRLTGAA